MNLPIPEASQVIEDLKPIIPLLYQAIEHGTEQARTYFDKEKNIDPWLGAHIARRQARKFLVSQGLNCEKIANSGIMFEVNGYTVRILKADNEGEVPPPGHSKEKQAYYGQNKLQMSFPFCEDGSDYNVVKPNLIITWDATRNFVLKRLKVACPKTGDHTEEKVEVYWMAPLLHPAETYQSIELVDFDDVTDIDGIKEINVDSNQTGLI